MAKIPHDPKEIFDEFTKDYQDCLWERSALLFFFMVVPQAETTSVKNQISIFLLSLPKRASASCKSPLKQLKSGTIGRLARHFFSQNLISLLLSTLFP